MTGSKYGRLKARLDRGTYVKSVIALLGTVLNRFIDNPRYIPLHPFSSRTSFVVSISAFMDNGCVFLEAGRDGDNDGFGGGDDGGWDVGGVDLSGRTRQ